jgi:hypothetical protein
VIDLVCPHELAEDRAATKVEADAGLIEHRHATAVDRQLVTGKLDAIEVERE